MRVMNMRIVKTLMKKDFKNCMTNKNLLFSLAIPAGFCILYNYLFRDILEMSSIYVLQLCAIMAIALVPTTILPVMIAEEKEKYTLRSLMLAQVGGMEFLAGKVTVCMGLTFIDAVIVFFLAGGKPAWFVVYAVYVLLASLGLSFLGAVAGLMAKDQTSAGTIGAPLLLLVMIPPFFSMFGGVIEKISVLVPSTSFQTVFLSAVEGRSLLGRENLIADAVCIVWIVAGYAVFHVFYKRKGIDY